MTSVSAAVVTLSHSHDDVAVVGCPDMVAPPGVWLKRSGDVMSVGCARSAHTWHLACSGVTWVGDLSLCDVIGRTSSRLGERVNFNF